MENKHPCSAGRGLLLGTDLERAARGVRQVQDLEAFRQLVLRWGWWWRGSRVSTVTPGILR